MNTIDIFLMVTSLMLFLLSFLILRGKDKNIIFSLFIFFIGLWSFGIILFRITTSIDKALLFANTNYVTASIICALFLHFSIALYNNKKIKNIIIAFIYLPTLIIILIINFEPNILLTKIYTSTTGNKLASVNILYYVIYSIYFISYVIISYLKLFRNYKRTLIIKERTQLKFIIMGTIFPYIFAAFFNLILPPFNYSYTWAGPMFALAVILIITHAIYKHHLFDTKVIMTELFVIGLWIIILIKITLSNSTNEIIINLALLIVTIIFGMLLIFTALSESRQKETLKDLSNKLSQKVTEQTLEIQTAYELEKKARRELEKLNETKDQFIMITQHHLRLPVFNIQSELNTMTDIMTEHENSLPDDIKNLLTGSMKNAQLSATRLARIVDDFLNVSTLKVSSKILNISSGNILPLLKDILSELRIDINNMCISINFDSQLDKWPEVKMDLNKIREALLIIIENAVRYNIKNGIINIHTKVENNIFEIIVENTGIGITFEEKSKLFSKLFFRGGRAKNSHPIGMGIGLSVARAIIRAHHGDIHITSEGENKGAKVIISIPTDYIKQLDLIL